MKEIITCNICNPKATKRPVQPKDSLKALNSSGDFSNDKKCRVINIETHTKTEKAITIEKMVNNRFFRTDCSCFLSKSFTPFDDSIPYKIKQKQHFLPKKRNKDKILEEKFALCYNLFNYCYKDVFV